MDEKNRINKILLFKTYIEVDPGSATWFSLFGVSTENVTLLIINYNFNNNYKFNIYFI